MAVQVNGGNEMNQNTKQKIKDFFRQFLVSFAVMLGFSILIYVVFVAILMLAS